MNEYGLIFDENIKKNTKLYRYMSLGKFMCMVEKKETYLTNIKSWEDKWELPINEIEDKNLLESDLYGQCWSLEGISDALWRIYSSNKEGILIKTSPEKFNLISDIRFGILSPVIYYNNLRKVLFELKNIGGSKRLFVKGLLKRSAFKHENEVRLIVINDEKCLGKKYKNCTHINLKIDPFKFIEGIIIDPRASDWYVEAIKAYCLRVGFNIIPVKSDLYSPNDF
ncbi:DUF2971 domain-containing protein [Clostridium sp. P21]|uniref:DUF2971 domain-containing protein n=1 Tax=Clostridium muellerianum TaxID=2716538 RepID=A0A7Y0HRB7_9CLOT|nr:DUF2971 domain-containing protein [Clostridium muellerianum]NMM65642.1 DUF2971 domain-containing protein [Clostridium muellerianum]